MGRLTTCLLVLATVATPVLAGTGRERHTPDGPGAIRLVSAFGVITSTWRSTEHNRAVGGVPNSYHLHAQAMDVVRRPGVTHRQIDAALRSAGYNLIESLDEGDHSHFAFAWGGSQMASAPDKGELTKWGVVTVSSALLR